MARCLRLASEIELLAISARRRGRWQQGTPTNPGEGAESSNASGRTPPLAPATPSPRTLYPLVSLCRAHGLPEPVPEYQFNPARKWRADYCWLIPRKVIVEIDGGIWSGGRHSGGSGQLRDMEKLNSAGLLGFTVLRYTPQQLGHAIRDLRILFAA